VQDDPRSGQPKTQRTDANVDRVEQTVNHQCYWEGLSRLWESGGRYPNSGLTCGFSVMTVPLHMMC
jgi:hypothetical protein